MSTPRFLMCPPTFFGVDYVINPWMEGQIGAVDRQRAQAQWDALYELLKNDLGAEIELITPQEGLPDMVFTANAAVIDNGVALVSNFWHPERQGETQFFAEWFQENGFSTSLSPVVHEGAGDMLFWTAPDKEPVLVAAAGIRTDPSAHPYIAATLDRRVVSVRLVTTAFYHLDTCFAPLPGGRVIWYPPAFDEASQETIRALIPAELRFELPDDDARHFAGNAVGLPGAVVMGYAGAETRAWLEGQGFAVRVTPLDEFLKAGGSAKCLTLRLDSGLV